MKPLHSLLKRQLVRQYGSLDDVPEAVQAFLETVNDSYLHFDEDREMLERSLELSSDELLQMNAEMRAVIQAFPDLFMWIDHSGRILDCRGGTASDAYAPPDTLVGKRFQDVPLDDCSAAFTHAIKAIAESGDSEIVEYSMDLSGKPAYFEARMIALRKDQILVIIRNITERKTSHKRIEEQRNFLRQVIDINPNLIFAKDADGRFVLVNQAFAEAFGTTVADLLGKTDADVNLDPEEIKHFRRDEMEVFRNQADKLIPEEWLNVATGEKRWYQTIKRPIFDGDGKVRQCLGVATDITMRRQAEEALAAEKEHLAVILRSIMDSVVAADAGGHILMLNKAAEALCVCRQADAIGHKIEAVFHLIDEASGKRLTDLVTTILAADEHSGVDGEVALTSPGGERRHLSMNGAALRGMDGDVIGLVMVFRDITEQRRAQLVLAKEHRSLEATVKVKTKELRKSLKDLQKANLFLEEANKHKNRFLSSMSHELRTPLHAILGFTDLLAGEFYGQLNETQQTYIGRINDNGKHLQSLITDLLDLARIDAGKMELEITEFPPGLTISQSVNMLNSQFRKRELEVGTECDPNLTSITADKRKFNQIMLNLLSNALKYTPTGGSVHVRAFKVGAGTARIEVRDTGIGIGKKETKKIFSEFYQTDRARDEQLGGTGIGLALTRRLVEMHKGKIGVDSELGKGSTFWFELPLAKSEFVKTRLIRGLYAGSRPGNMASRRLLVAEDNQTNLAVLLDMLSIHNHDVAVARNGQEALELATAQKPDLILMDISMPIMDGLEAARRIKEIPEICDVPIIALTANAGQSFAKKARDAGCVGFLEKPVQSKDLFRAIHHHLEGGITVIDSESDGAMNKPFRLTANRGHTDNNSNDA